MSSVIALASIADANLVRNHCCSTRLSDILSHIAQRTLTLTNEHPEAHDASRVVVPNLSVANQRPLFMRVTSRARVAPSYQ